MAVDLKFAGYMQRYSLVLLDDQLVELQHSMTRDRVRRIHFDRIDSVVVWRRMARGRLLLVFVLLGLPAILLLSSGFTVALFSGALLLAIAALLGLHYLYAGRSTIRVVRAGRTYEYSGVIRRARLGRFVSRLERGIRSVQAPAQSGDEVSATERADATW